MVVAKHFVVVDIAISADIFQIQLAINTAKIVNSTGNNTTLSPFQ